MTLPVSKGLSGLRVLNESHPNQNTHLYTGLYSGRVETTPSRPVLDGVLRSHGLRLQL